MVRAVASGFFQYPANVPGCLVRISPVASSMRSSMPACGSPTVPSFTLPGRFAVAIAVFSVIPYNSCIGTPMPMKNRNTSGATGAAPDEAYRTFRKPIRSRNAL